VTAVTYRELAAHRPFLKLWSGHAASLFGDALGRIALPVLAFAITSRVDVLGYVFAAQKLPSFVLAPVAGLLADRLDRRTVLRAALLTEAVAVGAMAFSHSAWQVIALALLAGTGQVVQGPARGAALPVLLGERLFPLALAVHTATIQITDVLGQAVGGLVVTVFSARTVLLLDAVTFLVFALVVPRLPNAPAEEPGRSPVALWRQLYAGILAAVRDSVVRTIVALMVVRGLTVTAGISLLYAVVEERTDDAPLYFGLLSMVFGAALTGSSLWFGRRADSVPLSHALVRYTAAGAVCLVPLALHPPLPVLVPILIGLGLFYAPGNIAANAAIARRAPEAIRGQVISAGWALIMGSQVIGGVLVGVTARGVGPDNTVALAGLTLAIACVLLLRVGRIVDR
jgi:MFS family permease